MVKKFGKHAAWSAIAYATGILLFVGRKAAEGQSASLWDIGQVVLGVSVGVVIYFAIVGYASFVESRDRAARMRTRTRSVSIWTPTRVDVSGFQPPFVRDGVEIYVPIAR